MNGIFHLYIFIYKLQKYNKLLYINNGYEN